MEQLNRHNQWHQIERTFKVSWIQDTDLIAATLLDERGLKSIVEWKGQLSEKATIRPSG
jgi:hypothetical protein